ncbi:MAG TPA: plastocyanin/azurin family copper-binding protein [Gemmatimonadaceae bacterium]|nr:plastocyanin/azurin family copper-binding protein [Gemmatimonadaceae bacterium]
MRYRGLLVVSGLAALIACGGSSSITGSTNSGGGGPPPPPPNGSVHIQDFSFGPETVTVKVGQTVQWTNDGPSAHTTTSDAGLWSSNSLAAPGDGTYGNGTTAGGTFSFTFTQAGTYTYHCSNHPPNLYPHFKGVVVVTP